MALNCVPANNPTPIHVNIQATNEAKGVRPRQSPAENKVKHGYTRLSQNLFTLN